MRRANAEAQGAITVDLPSPHGASADHPFKGDMDMGRFKRCALHLTPQLTAHPHGAASQTPMPPAVHACWTAVVGACVRS